MRRAVGQPIAASAVSASAAPDGSGQRDVSFGASLVLSRVNIDYAHQTRTTLGDYVHRFGVRFTL